MRYCCGIVLYNPAPGMLSNIRYFENKVEKIYIYDNSESPLENKIKLAGILKGEYQYISFEENRGLACALNEICKRALEEGFDYIFTMDQDSLFEEGAVAQMIEFAEKNRDYGMIVPEIVPYFDKIIRQDTVRNRQESLVKFAITSGSLVNLNAYKVSGGFDNNLFIEHVDVDFCIKLDKKQWSIIRLERAVLYQRAGNSVEKKLFGRTVHPLFASPVRGYYLFRNQKYLKKKYGKQIFTYTGKLYKTLLKTILYEDRKRERIKYYMKGYLAGRKDYMGKYELTKFQE